MLSLVSTGLAGWGDDMDASYRAPETIAVGSRVHLAYDAHAKLGTVMGYVDTSAGRRPGVEVRWDDAPDAARNVYAASALVVCP
jgi:hypothetical protein